MNKVYMIVNTSKDKDLSFSYEVIDWLQHQGVQVFVDPEIHEEYGLSDSYLIRESDLDTIDFAIVLGGDGTIIHSARRLAQHGLPILGINLGSLGFLAEIEQHEWKTSLSQVLEGKYSIQTRMMPPGKDL